MQKLYPLHVDFLRGNYGDIQSLQTKYIYIYKKKEKKTPNVMSTDVTAHKGLLHRNIPCFASFQDTLISIITLSAEKFVNSHFVNAILAAISFLLNHE